MRPGRPNWSGRGCSRSLDLPLAARTHLGGVSFFSRTARSLQAAAVWLAIIRGSASRGGIAQLGERLHGMQEVIGSIPFTSTIRLSREEKQALIAT